MAQKITIQNAKARLSELIDAALAGEDIVILMNGKPVVQLVPIPQTEFKIGLLEGKLGAGPDFFAPLDETDLLLWE